MSETHWKKLTNPEYLGAYAFRPGEEKIVTIESVALEELSECLPGGFDLERFVETRELRRCIDRFLAKLPERERQVIALRFYHGMTQQNCARVLHVSQVQVSRLERRAIDELRELLSE